MHFLTGSSHVSPEKGGSLERLRQRPVGEIPENLPQATQRESHLAQQQLLEAGKAGQLAAGSPSRRSESARDVIQGSGLMVDKKPDISPTRSTFSSHQLAAGSPSRRGESAGDIIHGSSQMQTSRQEISPSRTAASSHQIAAAGTPSRSREGGVAAALFQEDGATRRSQHQQVNRNLSQMPAAGTPSRSREGGVADALFQEDSAVRRPQQQKFSRKEPSQLPRAGISSRPMAKILNPKQQMDLQEKLLSEVKENLADPGDIKYIMKYGDTKVIPQRFSTLIKGLTRTIPLESLTMQDILSHIAKQKATEAESDSKPTPVAPVSLEILDSTGQKAKVTPKHFSTPFGDGVISIYQHNEREKSETIDRRMIGLVFHGHSIPESESGPNAPIQPEGAVSSLVHYDMKGSPPKSFGFLVPDTKSLSRAENPEVLSKKYLKAAELLRENRDNPELRSESCPNHTLFPHAIDFEGPKGENDRKLLGSLLENFDIAIFDSSSGAGHKATGRFHLKDILESMVLNDYSEVLLLGCRTPFSSTGDVKLENPEFVPDGNLYTFKGVFTPPK